MHGRVKVKTSDQIEAENLVKREKKLKYFQNVVRQIFELRLKQKNNTNELKENNDASDNQFAEKLNGILLPLLKLTAEVLLNSPDIFTFWNIRRETLLEIKRELRDNESVDEQLSKYWKSELELTMHSLPSNPKSYGIWHHRCWTMLQIQEPDWNKEIELCTLYLQSDERNFHCWDYRRFVVKNSKQAEKGAETELEFSYNKIMNISNYSAWHYRSKLLPIVYPSPESSIGVSESERRKELQLVENAMYTDPADSSAWFYFRWLLSSCNSTNASTEPKLQIIKRLPSNHILIATSARINANDTTSLRLINTDDQLHKNINVSWKSVLGEKTDTLWISNEKIEFNLKVILFGSEATLDSDSATVTLDFLSSDIKPDEDTLQILKQEKETLMELIDLNESAVGSQAASAEEKKWTKLNLALVTKTIDDTPECQNTILDMFTELEAIDSKRKGYYADQRSRFVVEHKLTNGQLDKPSINLSNYKLSSLYHKQYLCHVNFMDLSCNRIKSIDTLLPYLLECHTLILDDNEVEKLECIDSDLPKNDVKNILPEKLKILSLKRNPIEKDHHVVSKVKSSDWRDIVVFSSNLM